MQPIIITGFRGVTHPLESQGTRLTTHQSTTHVGVAATISIGKDRYALPRMIYTFYACALIKSTIGMYY
jgi:hypothetical protein